MFGVYRRYPFPVPLRTKVFNVFRYIFTFPLLEKFLVVALPHAGFTFKFIPPIYFYKPGSFRMATRDHIHFRLDISKLLDSSIYFYRLKDLAWDNLFKILKPNFHIIDAGANIGYLTLHFARICSSGRVYSFEPDSENFKSLQANFQLNRYKTIQLFKYALGVENGVGELYRLYLNNPGANRILKQKPEDNFNSETVKIVSLDSLFEEKVFERVDLIKIDVEGFELFVLKGAPKIINEWRPILFLELVDINLHEQNCTAPQVLKFIDDLNYYILDAHSMKPLDRSQKTFYTDIVCFPNNAAL